MLTFENIVKLPQQELKNALTLELRHLEYKTVTHKGFVYAKGKIPVLLIAHLDTVHRELPQTVCYSEDGNIAMSVEGIGGDDRAGVFMILEIVKKYRCHVLFCEDEETGGRGATAFAESGIKPKINYIVELDRRGVDDAVFYDCDNPEFTEFVISFGFKEAAGSFSDISIIAPALKIAAVNISAGYFNEHTLHEYVDFTAVRRNIERVGKMVSAKSKQFEYVDAQHFSLGRFGGKWCNSVYDIDDYFDEADSSLYAEYLTNLKCTASHMGIDEEYVELFLEYGYSLDEIEMMLYYPNELQRSFRALARA